MPGKLQIRGIFARRERLFDGDEAILAGIKGYSHLFTQNML